MLERESARAFSLLEASCENNFIHPGKLLAASLAHRITRRNLILTKQAHLSLFGRRRIPAGRARAGPTSGRSGFGRRRRRRRRIQLGASQLARAIHWSALANSVGQRQ